MNSHTLTASTLLFLSLVVVYIKIRSVHQQRFIFLSSSLFHHEVFFPELSLCISWTLEPVSQHLEAA